MKKNYRIEIITKADGDRIFYVQRRFLYFFWFYFTEIRDVSDIEFRIEFYSLEQAENFIDREVDRKEWLKTQRVVKKEYKTFN